MGQAKQDQTGISVPGLAPEAVDLAEPSRTETGGRCTNKRKRGPIP